MKFVETDGNNETEFFKMYPEYVNILREYDAEISATTMSEMKTRLRLPNSKVYLLQYHDDTVGFIILGTGFENSFSGHDIFIEEFFIKPEYQRKGFGRLAIIALIKAYPKADFSAFIIQNNEPAQAFWEETFAYCGYVERTLFGHITATAYGNLDFKYWIKQC